MICDNRWMGSLAQMSYMFGVFTGAVVLGSLADKYAIIIYIITSMNKILVVVGTRQIIGRISCLITFRLCFCCVEEKNNNIKGYHITNHYLFIGEYNSFVDYD